MEHTEQEYLVLRFEDAKLIRTHDNTTDKSFDLFKVRVKGNEYMTGENRRNVSNFVEPITVYQISNVLHALFGERPVPSNRTVVYDKNEYLFDKANHSYLKIESMLFKDEKYPKGRYQEEIMQTKKAVYNSYNNKNLHMSWHIVKCYLGVELYTEFLNDINKLNITPSDDFLDVRQTITANIGGILSTFMGKLKSCNKTALFKYFESDGKVNTLAQSKEILLYISSSIDKCSKLSGKIFVPIDEDDKITLSRGNGSATILDGGLVSIVDVDNRFEEGCILVSKISKERKLYNENNN